MKAGRFINGWTVTAAVLAVIIIVGGIIIWSRAGSSQSLEITLEPDRKSTGSIYVGGEVHNPGYYSLKDGDTVEDILQAAGGVTDGADLNDVELIVSLPESEDSTQKININRAEAWLLGALPGIGEVRAQAIVDYRTLNGPFRDIYELKKVEGLGDITFERIEQYITVDD
ncbi:MAG: ComEA family DNA-binding protein [Dehalococcoidales bacterium]|nr:ComEA family DNA-binding protein [Dehalococcoidales bacterium]